MSTRSSQGRSVCSYLTDEGRPLGVGLQERTSNRLSAAVDKSHGRERGGKGPAKTRSGIRQEEDRKGTTAEVSKAITTMSKPRSYYYFGGHSSDGTC